MIKPFSLATKVLVLALGLSSAAFNSCRGDNQRLAYLEAAAKKLLEGCIIKASDGTPLYTPDGKAHYAALWTRDFASMVENAGDR